MIEAISHLIHRDYEAIVVDFVTLGFIPGEYVCIVSCSLLHVLCLRLTSCPGEYGMCVFFHAPCFMSHVLCLRFKLWADM
jgi:hypothetical protein